MFLKINQKISDFVEIHKKGMLILDILNRIINLLNGKNQKELTDYLGLRDTAFSDWKHGKSESYKKYLIEISEFFGVSIDYLVYGKSKYLSGLPDEEQECLQKFKKLSPIDRGRILERMDTMYSAYTPEQKENVS